MLITELLQLDRTQVFIYSVWSKCLKLLSTVDFTGDEWKTLIGPLQSSLFQHCVMALGISLVYMIAIRSRSSHGIVQTPQQRGHHSSRCQAPPPAAASRWLLCRKTAPWHRQLVGPLGWVPSGTKEKRGGEGMEKRREKRRELKWNAWIWVGKWVLFLAEAVQADSLTCVHVTQCVWLAKRTAGYVIQTPNNALHCSIGTLTSQHSFPMWWRQRRVNLPG